MGRTAKVLLIAAPLAAGAAAVAAGRRGLRTPAASGHHVITVFRPPDELEAGRLPGSLREIASEAEVTLRAAPGGRGTEITVRIPEASLVTDGEVRRALRETRSLLEAGDVLLPSGPATTHPTPLNKPLREATRRGREGGLL
jgi:hypothetical protein